MEPLLDLALLLFGTKFFGILFKKLHQPSVAGELVGGVVLGPSILAIVKPSTFVTAIADLGLIFLILLISLGVEWKRIEDDAETFVWLEVGRILLAGFIGYMIGFVFGFNVYSSVAIGAVMALSSTAIVSRTIADLKKMDTKEGEIAIGLQVVDEVVAIVAIAIIAGFFKGDSLGIYSVFSTILIVIGFFVVTGRVGFKVVNKLTSSLQKYGIEDTLFGFTLLLALILASVTESLNLATLLGVFLTGMILSKSAQSQLITRKVKDVGENFFIPIFFGSLGLAVNIFAINQYIVHIFVMIALFMGVKYGSAYIVMRFSKYKDMSRPIASTFVTMSEMTLVIAAIGISLIDTAVSSILIVSFIIISALSPLVIGSAFNKKNEPKQLSAYFDASKKYKGK